MKNSVIRVAAVTALILIIPIVAMQFNEGVVWTLSDFVAMGALILVTGVALEIAAKKIRSTKPRIILCVAIMALFLFVWVELALGIIGTPFAGS